MSKKLEQLKARLAAQKAEDEEKDEPTDEGQPAGEEKPADEGQPAEGAPSEEERPAEETPPDEGKPGEETSPDEDDDDKDGAKALAYVVNQLAAARAERDSLKAEVARLKGALADPAFANAALRAQEVPASPSDGADGRMSRAQADAAYAKLATPAERAAFRRAHAAELGLR